MEIGFFENQCYNIGFYQNSDIYWENLFQTQDKLFFKHGLLA